MRLSSFARSPGAGDPGSRTRRDSQRRRRVARVPNTTNLCFEGIEGESLVIALDLKGFCVSSGSACSSGAVEPSHVLLALGMPKQRAKSSVRFSLGAGNTPDQVDELICSVAEAAAHLRRLSPTYIAHA